MVDQITSNERDKGESIGTVQRDWLVLQAAIREAKLCDRLRQAAEDAAGRDAA